MLFARHRGGHVSFAAFVRGEGAGHDPRDGKLTADDNRAIRICEPDVDLPAGDGPVARGFTVDTTSGTRELIVVRAAGELKVYENRCPHTGVALNWLPDQFLDVQGELLQCATHGALFDPRDGRCLRGPCVGQSLHVVAAHVEDGVLYLEVQG